MFKPLKRVRFRLGPKLIRTVGATLLISISTWAYFNIKYQRDTLTLGIINDADRLSETIMLGTNYAMMLNSRDDITQIIQNIGRQKDIQTIRIYNKEGQIKFSNHADDVDRTTNIKDEACYICHRTDPPIAQLNLAERTRMFTSPEGFPLLGIISPIVNEPGCAADCHIHPHDKQILGALDVVVSLAETEQKIVLFEKWMIIFGVFLFIITSTIIFTYVFHFVHQPIQKLIEGTRRIAEGAYGTKVDVRHADEIGELAETMNMMGYEIGEKQAELNRQRDEYQHLFEVVPCLITVQDKDYRLLQYNKEFQDMFDPDPNDYCYHAYKGRDTKCDICPVEKTFLDGKSHYSEESGINKDGSITHWIVRSSPLRNDDGEVVAAMEVSLDITPRKRLEEELKKSEQKYYAFFSNIPNPVFVLDMESLEILDCNESVTAVYGFTKEEVIRRSFLDFFRDDEREFYRPKLSGAQVLDQVAHLSKTGRQIFVNIRISPSEYQDQKVFLVTTSDITQRLEAEQLIQASKMATLGEMATGVAHELNQPLSVIKTASTFLMKKIDKSEVIRENILFTLCDEIDSHVDRATKIITHMRHFGRMSDMKLEMVQINDLLKSAYQFFSQQLKVRGITVDWDIQEQLPEVMGNPDRLEQVFINLLINARDAIEEKFEGSEFKPGDKRISLKTYAQDHRVTVEVSDSGAGIPKKIAEKIFEPFFTTKDVGKGTGLCLSISYGIIKEIGGEIRVNQLNGEGACFVIHFPSAEEE